MRRVGLLTFGRSRSQPGLARSIRHVSVSTVDGTSSDEFTEFSNKLYEEHIPTNILQVNEFSLFC